MLDRPGSVPHADDVSSDLHVGKAEVERKLPLGRARILRFEPQSIDVLGSSNSYRVDFSLTPRSGNGGVCLGSDWNVHQARPLGMLYVLPPGQTVRARGDCGSHSSMVCDFEPDAIDRWFDGDIRWTNRRVEAMLNITNPNMIDSLRRLSDELRHPGLASAMVCELLAAQIAIDAARHCKAADEAGRRGGLPAWKLKLIDERLAELGAAPSLRELADLCQLSVRQLTRGFRASRQCSIGEYLTRNRIEHAKRLLATDISIKEVALSLGFTTPANFSTAFRRATGETPRQFRERNQWPGRAKGPSSIPGRQSPR